MTGERKLTSDAVEAAFMDSLARTPGDGLVVEGVVRTVAFDRDVLEAYRDEVKGWIGELPPAFLPSNGGGWSFLNLDTTREGVQWTGFHLYMEQLLQLAIGLGLAKMLLPRELWPALPGGMPYVVFDPEGVS